MTGVAETNKRVEQPMDPNRSEMNGHTQGPGSQSPSEVRSPEGSGRRVRRTTETPGAEDTEHRGRKWTRFRRDGPLDEQSSERTPGELTKSASVVGVRAEALEDRHRGLLGRTVPLDRIQLPKKPRGLLNDPLGRKVAWKTKGESGETQTATFVGRTHTGKPVVDDGSSRPRVVARAVAPRKGGEPTRHPLQGVSPRYLRRPGAELKAALTTILDHVEPGHLPARAYADALVNAGHAVYVVGGAVRDAIRQVVQGGGDVRDVDLVTTALPKDIRDVVGQLEARGGQPVSSPSFVDQFGAVLLEGDKMDLVTLKVGSKPHETPKKSKAIFGSDVMKDAGLRDFTLNALYYDPVNGVVVDPTGRGVQDAADGVLRLAENPDDCNASHALRYFKFRGRGYEPAEGLMEQVRAIAERTFGARGMPAKVARISVGSADHDDAARAWLSDLRRVMDRDGMADLYDRHIAPDEDEIVRRIVERNR